MKAIEILKTRRDELVQLTLNLLPIALSGDRANRTFYFKINDSGTLVVDYLYYLSQQSSSDNEFYTISVHETPCPEEFGFESIEEMDFDACGYREFIENSIDKQIEFLEQN